MPNDRAVPPTSIASRQFEVWFGAIFLGVGLVVLAVGLVLYLLLRDDAYAGDEAWIALVIPLCVGSPFLVIGGFFFRKGLEKVQREDRIREIGTTTEATVVAVEPTNTRVNGRRLWHIRYTYEDHLGGRQKGESGYLSSEDARSYRVRQKVFIQYDPDHPTESIWLGRDQFPNT